jgi:heme oxygenase
MKEPDIYSFEDLTEEERMKVEKCDEISTDILDAGKKLKVVAVAPTGETWTVREFKGTGHRQYE